MIVLKNYFVKSKIKGSIEGTCARKLLFIAVNCSFCRKASLDKVLFVWNLFDFLECYGAKYEIEGSIERTNCNCIHWISEFFQFWFRIHYGLNKYLTFRPVFGFISVLKNELANSEIKEV